MGAVNHVEQRWSQRRSVNLDVDIVYGDETLASCHAVDVGLGGVFLEFDDQQQPPIYSKDVELLFYLSGRREGTKHRLNARVVRSATNGVGLSFKDFDTRAFRSLQEIMRHVPLSEPA